MFLLHFLEYVIVFISVEAYISEIKCGFKATGEKTDSKIICSVVFVSFYWNLHVLFLSLSLFCIVLVDFKIVKQTDNCEKMQMKKNIACAKHSRYNEILNLEYVFFLLNSIRL